MKTEAELVNEFIALEKGVVRTVEVPDIIKFDVRLSWQEDVTVDIQIVNSQVSEKIKQFGLKEGDFLCDDYFLEHHAAEVNAFQRKIEAFDQEAKEWGLTNHNDKDAFYMCNVWTRF